MDVLSVHAGHEVMDANEDTEIADIATVMEVTEIATGMEMMPVMDKLVINSSPERDMEVQLYA